MLRVSLVSSVKSLFQGRQCRRKGYQATRPVGADILEPRILLAADADLNGTFATATNVGILAAGDPTENLAGIVNRATDVTDGAKFTVAAGDSVIGTLTLGSNTLAAGQSYTVTLYGANQRALKSATVTSTTAVGTSIFGTLAAGQVYFVGVTARSGAGDIAYDIDADLTEIDPDSDSTFAKVNANALANLGTLAGGDPTENLAGTVNLVSDITDGRKFTVGAAANVVGTLTLGANTLTAGQSYTVTLYGPNQAALRSFTVTSTTAVGASISGTLTRGVVYFIGITAKSGTGDLAYDIDATLV